LPGVIPPHPTPGEEERVIEVEEIIDRGDHGAVWTRSHH